MTTKKITRTTTRKGNKRIVTIIEEELAAGSAPVVVAPPVPAPPPAKLKVNYVTFLLDTSSSMSGCIEEAQRQLRANLANVRENAARTGQITLVSFYTFDDYVRSYFTNVPIERCPDLPVLATRGMTALCDGVYDAIRGGEAVVGAADADTSHLVICATDGGENASTRCPRYAMESHLRRLQLTDRWTFAFMVPPGGTRAMIALGVPAGNVVEWQNTTAGAAVAFNATAQAVSNYYDVRQAGLRSTQKFFVETDLSKLTKSDVQTKLDDLRSNFKAAQVDKEVGIKEFAEEKTGRPYVIGSLYYALTKKEKVQPQKDVLLMEKGGRGIFGGPGARALIGLPAGVEATVTPGNHANYDVYVKSTSVNRKLVRGTKVLIDLTKTVPDKETWDSAGAQAAADLKKAQATLSEAQAKVAAHEAARTSS